MQARCAVRNDTFQRCTRAEGHPGEHKAARSKGTTLRNFRCDDERWDTFTTACAEEGTDASAQIRALMDDWLAERVTD